MDERTEREYDRLTVLVRDILYNILCNDEPFDEARLITQVMNENLYPGKDEDALKALVRAEIESWLVKCGNSDLAHTKLFGMTDPVHGGIQKRFFYKRLKNEQELYDDKEQRDREAEFLNIDLPLLAKMLQKPMTMDDLVFWGFEHDGCYARFHTKDGIWLHYLSDHDLDEKYNLWTIIEHYHGTCDNPLKTIEWFDDSSPDIELSLYPIEPHQHLTFDIVTFDEKLTDIDWDDDQQCVCWGDGFKLEYKEGMYCESYVIYKNGEFLAGFEDSQACYQLGDGGTCVFVNANNDLFVQNTGDVCNLFVVRYKPTVESA